MPFVELFTPRGALSEQRRSDLSRQLVAEVMLAEGAPDTPAAQSISWLVVHEVESWVVGGAPLTASDPPKFVVRVSVPAGSLNEAKRSDMVARVTRLLAAGDDEPERFYAKADAWVHITEIAEGNWGALGRVVGLTDIARFVATSSPQLATSRAAR